MSHLRPRPKMGPPSLVRSPHYSGTAMPPHHYSTISTEEAQVQYSARIDKAAVLSWQYTHHTSRTTRAIDAMRGREQCLILDRTPKPPDGHKCRGECGVCLHGIHFVVKWKILTVIIHSTASVRHALRPRQLPTPYICSVL